MPSSETFDYIIIGAGSAGCVLAHRLTEDAATRVLLLEAGGPDRDPFIHIPLALGKLWNERRHDWGFDTEPQPGANGRRIPLPRGKVLGGSSSINAMTYMRGTPGDYDRWARNGATGWSFAEVLPYFKRGESWAGGADSHRGGDGPIGVSPTDPHEPLTAVFIEAGREAGHVVTDDINGAVQNGFGRTQSTIRDGRRSSASVAYLRPALLRANLTLRVNALTTRVLIENGRAIGVEYLQGGTRHRVNADAEVIVAAGAIHSPQLLTLSGIGPAEKLRLLGIPIVRNAPGVGQNLQDHLMVPVFHERRAPGHYQQLMRMDRIVIALARAYWFGRGPATHVPSGSVALIHTRPGLDAPDIQFVIRSTSRDAKPWWPGTQPNWTDHLGIIPSLLHPVSRGTLDVVSADPLVAPRIDPGFLVDSRDVDTLVAGVKMARNVLRQPSLDRWRGVEVAPGPSITTDAAIADYVRASATTFQHVAGTCRMGSDADAVVDPQLRVRGVERLRVIDASVMPDLVSGNINACVLMIAERGADLVRG